MAHIEDEIQLEVPAEKFEQKGEPLPEGKYTIVACDIDTTGRRLIDEVSYRTILLYVHIFVNLYLIPCSMCW